MPFSTLSAATERVTDVHEAGKSLALITAGVIYMLVLRAVRPRVIEHAAALLKGDEEVPAAA
jgi:hypothetical protein